MTRESMGEQSRFSCEGGSFASTVGVICDCHLVLDGTISNTIVTAKGQPIVVPVRRHLTLLNSPHLAQSEGAGEGEGKGGVSWVSSHPRAS